MPINITGPLQQAIGGIVGGQVRKAANLTLTNEASRIKQAQENEAFIHQGGAKALSDIDSVMNDPTFTENDYADLLQDYTGLEKDLIIRGHKDRGTISSLIEASKIKNNKERRQAIKFALRDTDWDQRAGGKR